MAAKFQSRLPRGDIINVMGDLNINVTSDKTLLAMYQRHGIGEEFSDISSLVLSDVK